MSLFIDSRKIIGVYALGQWFNIKPDTFAHDSYELICWQEDVPFGNELNNKYSPDDLDRQPHSICFAMGDLYEHIEPTGLTGYQGDGRMSYKTPRGCDGITFIDADTGNKISMSLIEIKAFKEQSEEETSKACPYLKGRK